MSQQLQIMKNQGIFRASLDFGHNHNLKIKTVMSIFVSKYLGTYFAFPNNRHNTYIADSSHAILGLVFLA